MQQQAMAAALMESLQASARYQALIQRANSDGMERLQNKLAEHSEPGRQIDSLKGLYDLWVDAAEEAYAEIALSDEFRDAYAKMINTQMRVRHMQQQQTEQFCQQLGMPTRSDVEALGKRLQAMRRELAGLKAASASSKGAAGNTGPAVKTAVSPDADDTMSAPRTPITRKSASRKPATRKTATKKALARKAPAKKAAPRKAVASKVQVKVPSKTAGKAKRTTAPLSSARKRK